MKQILFIITLLIFYGCQKERISFSSDASEIFYVENAGASMRVLIPLGEDFYNHISSIDKKIVVSSKSGHNMILQDKKFFCNEVASFILSH